MANDKGVDSAHVPQTRPHTAESATPGLPCDSYLLAGLLEYSTDALYFKDLESRFIRINRQLARYFRIPGPEAAIGKTDRDFFTEEHAAETLRDEQTIIRSGQPLIGKEERETWPDGRVSWVFTSKMPLLNEWGEVIGTFGISRDMTELHYMKDALRTSEQRLKAIMAAMWDAVWIFDRAARKTIYVSPAYETIWGRACSRLYADAHDWCSAVLKEDREKALALQAAGEGDPVEGSYRIIRPDGAVRQILHRGFAVRDTSGPTGRTAMIACDITPDAPGRAE